MGNGRYGTGHGIRQHGRNSATGVAFSRDAATGENLFNGEYLINAQGEDVWRHPHPAANHPRRVEALGGPRTSPRKTAAQIPSLEEVMPGFTRNSMRSSTT
ncbi:MAG: hypothetical protein ACLT1W_12225 [Alistipes onderdonkii]